MPIIASGYAGRHNCRPQLHLLPGRTIRTVTSPRVAKPVISERRRLVEASAEASRSEVDLHDGWAADGVRELMMCNTSDDVES